MRHNFAVKRPLGVGAAVAALGAGFAAKPAAATPATLGFYPATDVYPKQGFHLDVDTYGVGLKANAASTVGLTYGVGPDRDGIFGRSEIGFDYFLSVGGVAGGSANDRLWLNGKTQLYNNDANGTRVVAGFWGVGNDASAAPNVLYVSGSKAYKWGRITGGVARSLQDEAIVGNDRTNLHLGYDKALSSKVLFAADWYSGDTSYSAFQPTLYYNINDKSSVGVGYVRYNAQVAPSRNQVYIAFDYNFGGAPAAPAK